MTNLPRRTIADLSVRYELEPNLKDIFVEGQIDKEIITQALRAEEQPFCIVYEIDTVDVPNELVKKYGFSSGNKQRVIVLAKELAHMNELCKFRCLVDKDLDHWLNSMTHANRLLWTYFSSLELHFFTEALMQDILLTTAKCHIPDLAKYLESMIDVLKMLYVLRLTDRELELNLDWINQKSCLSLVNELPCFDYYEYVKRLLNSNNQIDKLSEFQKTMEKWKNKLIGDHRQYIHGHDFISMIVWTILKTKGMKEFASVNAIYRILVLLSSQVEGIIETLDFE